MTATTDRQPGLPDGFEDALSHLQCALVARRSRTDPEGLTWQQYDALELLRLRGAMTPSQLGERLGVSRQTTSKALRVLKDLHLVGQRPAGPDRREVDTYLTPEGAAHLTRAAAQRRHNARTAAGALSPGERALFAELCARAARALEEDAG
ncbi:MarR family winged helix-turn-helix transcriptional regulator [Kitasatospora sp. NPDC101183]|uniref:MarR family winged helix-turn-helix transcriptional regulator n=1 Tax=Kitasatospora sp. NPDC101183 TaxID=3364100 RepID=UPI00381A3637